MYDVSDNWDRTDRKIVENLFEVAGEIYYMKKIGILTLYHNSVNYGAVLQAYALCRVINRFGYTCEQIDYAYNAKPQYMRLISKALNIRWLVKYIRRNQGKKKNHYVEIAAQRKIAFDAFKEKYIPHSEVYYQNELDKCGEQYDAFVVGSDQVWNPDWITPEMLLAFVPEKKIKISYAASIGKYKLTDNQNDFYKKYLDSFHAVSVRETSALSMIEKIYKGPVKKTLDPTLLLDADEWDEVCTSRLVDKKYIFCYFLSEDREQRKIAREYARRAEYKLVFIPHAYRYNSSDIGFAEQEVPFASPAEFLSLIKYADCIFTDSFHACVFSGIYKRQFWVFPRKDSTGMDTRIEEITSLFGAEDHFIWDFKNFSTDQLDLITPIKYDNVSEDVLDRRESIDFLKNYIN